MKKLLTTFRQYSEGVLLQIARAALQAVTGNAYFTDISPTPANTLAKTDDYESSLAQAATGDKTAIAKKNEIKNQLRTYLRSWAIYINMKADGNAEIIASSGMPVAKTPQPVQLTAPANIIITQGLNPGALIIEFQKPKGARGFIIKWAKAPITESSVWQTKGTGVVKNNVIEGLEEGAQYWFKIEAFNGKGETAVSDEVSCFVLQRSQNKAA